MELLGFAGLCKVFRLFLRDLSHIAALLRKKFLKDQPQTFDQLTNEKNCSGDAKSIFRAEIPVWALPLLQGAYTVDIDEYNDQIFCVPLERQPDSTDRPIGHRSHLLNDLDWAYDIMHWECLAVLSRVLLLWTWWCQFTVQKDQRALKRVWNLSDSTRKLTNWLLRLSKFLIHAINCPVIKNQADDASSLLKTTGDGKYTIEDKITVLVKKPFLPRQNWDDFHVNAYTKATAMEPRNHERLKSAHNFIPEQQKTRIVDKGHLQYMHKDRRTINIGMDFRHGMHSWTPWNRK